jgi:hypothetical protein
VSKLNAKGRIDLLGPTPYRKCSHSENDEANEKAEQP